MLQFQTQTEQYWTEEFEITQEDMEFLFSVFLEEEKPLSSQEIAQRFIRYRVEQEAQTLRRQIERGTLFQPKDTYEVGQSLVFPALDYAIGEVIGKRAGNNPEHGEFSVIQVTFEDGEAREFASDLKTAHALNLDATVDLRAVSLSTADESSLLSNYGDDIIYLIEERMKREPDVVYFAGRWFLKSLLATIGVAHLHLAEAVLVMHEGGPIDTSNILKEIDLPQEINPRLQSFSLDYALFHDGRFDEVGPSGKVLWYLREMEPEEVLTVPERLKYQPIDYDWRVMTDELALLEQEIDDELSNLRSPVHPAEAVTFSLNFPHRRTGTLPLNSHLRHLFPTAYEAPRVLTTLVDGQTGEEMSGWVVREHRFVYGLTDFYRRHKLPVGTYVAVRRTDDPSRVVIDFNAHRPRTEWIRLAVPGQNRRLQFENHKRAIGAEYDDLMILGADDLKGVDALWVSGDTTQKGLAELMRDLINELSRLNPQRTVHAKTIYSAVNVVRRCPPGPIFATLVARPEFEHAGGPYWRVAQT
ncbi:MAG: hypothetical protein HY866_09795 [Chloroflexi bacterium]|nr:hypothetical protein [Chloroflexota bacterium]